ncbi:MAG: hypothetical protein JOZ39_12415 [Chloroflexi bacterium]|nr:hypothetical protein [Chloroflexota bacterium]
MADKAAQVTSEGRKAFVEYRRSQNSAAREEETFVAGFMAGYLMGFAEAIEEDLFERVVGRMLQHHVNAIVVPHAARKYTLRLDSA